MSNTVQSFDAQTGSEPRVLILGSIPGIASLNAHQYYGHPRNAFWPIMCRYFQLDANLDYPQRLSQLLNHNIALWDVLASAERAGSLDSAIRKRSELLNPIDAFVRAHPTVKAILFNGAKADASFRKAYANHDAFAAIESYKMPSTSPAYAAMTVNEKMQQWHQVLSLYF